MRNILFLTLVLCGSLLHAMEDSFDKVSSTPAVYSKGCIRHLDKPEKFKKCNHTSIIQELKNHLEYPKELIGKGIDMKVLVEITIHPDGTFDSKILDSNNALCSIAILDALKKMHPWVLSARLGERPITSLYMLPLSFPASYNMPSSTSFPSSKNPFR